MYDLHYNMHHILQINSCRLCARRGSSYTRYYPTYTVVVVFG